VRVLYIRSQMKDIKQQYKTVSNSTLTLNPKQAKTVLVNLVGFMTGYVSGNSDVHDRVQTGLVNVIEKYIKEVQNNH